VAGKFSNSFGVAACASCVAGSYSSTRGAASCELCEPGKASETPAAASAEACTECPSGTVANAPGAAACVVFVPYDVCEAPKDCYELSEEEVGNVDVATLVGALPACIIGCVGTAGFDVPGLVATGELPDCQPMSELAACSMGVCEQGDIDKTTFCLLQDVLRNTCQEDFDAGVTYEGGVEPIVDL
jgi:hypothetical protein